MTAGQVFIGLRGPELTAEERELLLHPQIGGVVLFARNYVDPVQVAHLTSEIHAAREALLVAVDQEGGRVQRFDEGFTPLPAMGVLGRIFEKDPSGAVKATEDCGWVMARELHGVGVDLSFAPVVDMNYGRNTVIANRAFHRDPDVVAQLAAAWRRGVHAAGMAVVIKHFPGHGWVEADSHLELPVDERAMADIELADLQPFARLIAGGAEAVMMAHIRYDAIDPNPAGFSEYWVRTVLRGRFGFQGAIFSDDLDMGGAAWAGSLTDRTRTALAAGCDAVLICQLPDAVPAVLDDLGETTDPVARMRLSHLRGTRRWMRRASLLRDPEWQRRRDRVLECLKPQAGDLPLDAGE
ncbi:MAG: beta-N-acetylhexosaminidase [Gammaproteobacteria bacterium]|nr:beta-N-acetylhexosaminidase [Gammaproteobacteria bacterium]